MSEPQPVIRCSDCGGTVIWKQTAEGYEVIHGCGNGKQARAAIASAESKGWTDCLRNIRASVEGYPNEGGDIEVMTAIQKLIASAEAQARMEGMKYGHNNKHIACSCLVCAEITELTRAAARTPDSTKCRRCGALRSAHDAEQPYECVDTECEGFANMVKRKRCNCTPAGRGHWMTCTNCGKRIHKPQCTVRRKPDVDCHGTPKHVCGEAATPDSTKEQSQ